MTRFIHWQSERERGELFHHIVGCSIKYIQVIWLKPPHTNTHPSVRPFMGSFDFKIRPRFLNLIYWINSSYWITARKKFTTHTDSQQMWITIVSTLTLSLAKNRWKKNYKRNEENKMTKDENTRLSTISLNYWQFSECFMTLFFYRESHKMTEMSHFLHHNKLTLGGSASTTFSGLLNYRFAVLTKRK